MNEKERGGKREGKRKRYKRNEYMYMFVFLTMTFRGPTLLRAIPD